MRKNKNKNIRKESMPSGFQWITEYHLSRLLEEEETDILLSILCNTPNVQYKPRHSIKVLNNGITPHRWEVMGYYSYEHYLGYCQFQGLSSMSYEESNFDIIEKLKRERM